MRTGSTGSDVARSSVRNGYSCETERKKKWWQSFVVESWRFMRRAIETEATIEKNGHVPLGWFGGVVLRHPHLCFICKGMFGEKMLIQLHKKQGKGYAMCADEFRNLDAVGVLTVFFPELPCLYFEYSFLSIPSNASTVGSASFKFDAV